MISADRGQALFLVAQLAMPDYALAGVLRFPGLDPQARYRLTVVDHPDLKPVIDGGSTMRQLPAWMAASAEYSGEWLMKAGLRLPILNPETALLLALERL